jgi:putative ABC transport system permease protein
VRIPAGVRRVFRLPSSGERIARELDDEVRFHLETRMKTLRARGYSEEEARAEALRRFGDVDDLRDYCVSMEVSHMQRRRLRERISTVAQDLRFALRQIRKAPGFAIIATLTLALGVGATTAIFSVVNGVVLRPLPFAHPEQMVQLWGLDSKGKHLSFADPTFDAVASDTRSFSAVAEFAQNGMSIAENGEVERVLATAVSKQFFDVLKLKPAIGRLFAPEEQLLHAPMAVVISHGLWVRQFGSSPRAIGATLTSGNVPMTVIGVLPEGREFPASTDVWYAREMFEKNTSYTAHNWRVIGRVKDGVTLDAANRDLSMTLQRLHAMLGETTWTFDGTAVGLREQIVGDIKPLLLLLLCASGVLLLIACANVANLLIARMAVRENEIAVRVAIGAGRGRLVQQLLIEASLLAAAGCTGGLLLALASMKVLLTLRPALIPRVGELRIDWLVLAFAVLVSAGTAIVLGLVAAWRGTRGDLRAALAQSQRTQGGGGASYRIRGSLVVVQLAMTVVLLIGAGLLARSFVQLMTIDPGFRTHGVVVANLAFDQGEDSNRVARRTLYADEIVARARALPGVTAVGVSDAEPFSGGSSNGEFIELAAADARLAPRDLAKDFERMLRDKAHTGYASYTLASRDYFKALRIPLVSGRMFDETDRAGAPEVAIVNASLARKQWPGEDALGKVIEFGNIDGDLTPMTVIGVVGDTREEELATDPQPAIYVCDRQRPGNSPELIVIIATSGDAPVVASARQAFRQVRADVPMRFSTVDQIIARSVASRRFMLLLVGVFGGVALLLATLGVYSVISYLVAQRKREISIRVALGARAADIERLVVGQGIALALMGVMLGGLAALAATRVLKALLYSVSATDPVAFGGVLVLLSGIALLASYLPARRASRLEPMDVMKAG